MCICAYSMYKNVHGYVFSCMQEATEPQAVGGRDDHTVSAYRHRLTLKPVALTCRSQAWFCLEGYTKEDHQLNPHTKTYLHAAVNEWWSHQTVIVCLTRNAFFPMKLPQRKINVWLNAGVCLCGMVS